MHIDKNNMIEYSLEDRNDSCPEGWFTLYVVLVKYENKLLLKIGHCFTLSFLGRLAWNKFYNDGYHVYNRKYGIYNDEKYRYIRYL